MELTPLEILKTCTRRIRPEYCCDPQFWREKIEKDFPEADLEGITEYKAEYFILYNRELRREIEAIKKAKFADPELQKLKEQMNNLSKAIKALYREKRKMLESRASKADIKEINDQIRELRLEHGKVHNQYLEGIEKYRVADLKNAQLILRNSIFKAIREAELEISPSMMDYFIDNGPGIHRLAKGLALQTDKLISIGEPPTNYVFSWKVRNPETDKIKRMYEMTEAPEIPEHAIKWGERMGLTRRQVLAAFGVL